MEPLYDDKDLVKELKVLKTKGTTENGLTWLWLLALTGLFMARNAGYIKQIVTDIASILNMVVVCLGIGGRNISDRNRPHVRRLAYDIKKSTSQECKIESLDDIEILPRNIQIGWDLEAANAVPIFKEGHYIVINSSPVGFILQQVEMDGRKDVQILSPEETYELADELAVENTFVEKHINRLKKSYLALKESKEKKI